MAQCCVPKVPVTILAAKNMRSTVKGKGKARTTQFFCYHITYEQATNPVVSRSPIKKWRSFIVDWFLVYKVMDEK